MHGGWKQTPILDAKRASFDLVEPEVPKRPYLELLNSCKTIDRNRCTSTWCTWRVFIIAYRYQNIVHPILVSPSTKNWKAHLAAIEFSFDGMVSICGNLKKL